MSRDELTEKILDIKREKGRRWQHIATESVACRPCSSPARCSAR